MLCPCVQLAFMWMSYIRPERMIPESLPKLPNRGHTVWKYRSLVQGAYRACTMHVKASHGIKRIPGIYLIRMCVCSRVKPYGAPDLMWLRDEHLNRISAKHRAEPMIWCDWGISTLSTSFYPWLISRNAYRRSSVPLKFRTRDVGVVNVAGTQALEINHFPNFINASNISFKNNYFHWCKKIHNKYVCLLKINFLILIFVLYMHWCLDAALSWFSVLIYTL